MGNNRFAPKLRDFQNCIYWVADVLKAILGPHQKKHPLRCGRLVVVFLGFRFCLLISNPAPDGSCRCQLLRKRGLNRNTAETGVLIASGSGRMLDWAWVDSTCTHTHTHTHSWLIMYSVMPRIRTKWVKKWIYMSMSRSWANKNPFQDQQLEALFHLLTCADWLQSFLGYPTL